MECSKHLFDIPDGVTYLNTAYMSPLLKTSAEIGCEALKKKLRPYEISVDDFFLPLEKVKASFSQLIDLSDPQRIAIIPSVSYGIANACANIPIKSGDEIIIVRDQFPSNVYPWMELAKSSNGKLVIVDAPLTSDKKASKWMDRIFESINDKTRIIALPHVHWSEGLVFDLKAIRQRIHQNNGYLVIDGTQSIGAFPFSVEEIQPDALIVASYKWLMGPYALGLAYYSERFDQGKPIENNWINRLYSENFAGLVNYQESYKPKAHRYSVGESSNFASIPILQYALDKLLEWTPLAIQEYCGSIVNPNLSVLNEYGFHLSEEGQRSNHLFGIKVPTDLSLDVLKKEFSRRKIYVSFRGEYIRVSPFVINNQEDIRSLCDALIRVQKQHYKINMVKTK